MVGVVAQVHATCKHATCKHAKKQKHSETFDATKRRGLGILPQVVRLRFATDSFKKRTLTLMTRI